MASVLITGASKGIGRAAAAEFARRGHRVIATARDPRTLAGLPADQRLALDVTDPDSITSAVGEAGEIDVLVSNAGEIFYAAVEATPPGSSRGCWTSTRSVPCGWRRRSCRGCAPAAAGGCCSCPASPGASCGRAGAAYAATKWALEALVEALAIEAGPLGIEAALLEPGPVSSGAFNHVTTYTLPGDPYARLLTQGGPPASQMITPEEVAAGIADAAEAPQLPLRIPIGRPAAEILAARRAAPDDRPFIPGASTAVRS